jgi:hypothetical protein
MKDKKEIFPFDNIPKEILDDYAVNYILNRLEVLKLNRDNIEIHLHSTIADDLLEQNNNHTKQEDKLRSLDVDSSGSHLDTLRQKPNDLIPYPFKKVKTIP